MPIGMRSFAQIPKVDSFSILCFCSRTYIEFAVLNIPKNINAYHLCNYTILLAICATAFRCSSVIAVEV